MLVKPIRARKKVRLSERKDSTDDEALCWAHQVNMCALEALNKDFIYLDDEAAVQDKWSTTGGDQFSGVGAYAEITRINANVPKKLDKTEEEMRDFLLENPIDYRLGRGRLGMLRVHTV